MRLSEFIGRTIRCAWMKLHRRRVQSVGICSQTQTTVCKTRCPPVPTLPPDSTRICFRGILSQPVISCGSREKRFDLPWARRSKFYNSRFDAGINYFYNGASTPERPVMRGKEAPALLDASPRSELKN